MKTLKIAILALALSIAWNISSAKAETPKPSILETSILKADYGDQISVKGLAPKNSQVLIYINGSYYGFANISDNDPELNNFSYLSPVIKDRRDNEYSVLAIARDQDRYQLSSPVESKNFSIIKQSYLEVTPEKPGEKIKAVAPATKPVQEKIVPAPILITPKGNIGEYKPIISGFSKNDTSIKIYIDDIFEAELWASDTGQEKFGFKYSPNNELSRGMHSVYAIALDKERTESKKSNVLYFFIADPQYIATTSTSDDQSGQEVVQPNNDQEEATSSTPPITKSKKVNSAFNISLFILFFIGVLIWVITTNIELKKNQKKENEKNN